jgi:hypothetical protein
MISNSTDRSQAVSFAVYSELYIIPAGDHHGSAIWYSSQDKQEFRRSMVRDIKKVSRVIDGLPMEGSFTQDQLIDCLGIELFISKGAARSAAEVRSAHIHDVLAEQSRQRQNGICDIGRLSSISQKGSLWTKERARNLAVGYAALSMV